MSSDKSKSTVDEAAFIDAVQNDPEDEASRLVYADWLEERGDARAEYLRLETQYHRIRPRLDILSKTLDAEWLRAVSRTYAVILVKPGPNKIMTIKSVREITGLGLKDAKDLVEWPVLPVVIRDELDIVAAERVRKIFDGDSEVRIVSSKEASTMPRPFTIQLGSSYF